MGVCSPLQWRNRPRFPRGSLTFDCYSGRPVSAGFKEHDLVTAEEPECQEKSSNHRGIVHREDAELPRRPGVEAAGRSRSHSVDILGIATGQSGVVCVESFRFAAAFCGEGRFWRRKRASRLE